MFFGEFEYKLDDKGRVPLPPKFRGRLKDGVVLAPGPEEYITAYPVAEWKKLADGLTGSSVSKSKMRKLRRAIFATAFHLQLDNQGRIALPVPLRQYSGIEDEVVIAGVNTHLEIWGKHQWESEKAISQQQAWQIIESLENN